MKIKSQKFMLHIHTSVLLSSTHFQFSIFHFLFLAFFSYFFSRVSENSLCTCWKYITANVLMVTISVVSGPQGLGITLQNSHMPQKAYVCDFLNHFPFPTQYRYWFTTLLAGAHGLFAHPVVVH